MAEPIEDEIQKEVKAHKILIYGKGTKQMPMCGFTRETMQLVDGRRLIVIGLGKCGKFSAECLREAGATLAKAARKSKLRRLALVVPKLPRTLPGVPDAPAAGARERWRELPFRQPPGLRGDGRPRRVSRMG